MRVALVLTTINVPRVLSLYRARGPDVRFFVVADLKTPAAAYDFCHALPECEYISAHDQENSDFACAKLLPWNSVTRRNLAVLAALDWGAQVIVSVDDDNYPLDGDYFDDFVGTLVRPFDGLEVGGLWFDAGRWQFPADGAPVVQRGTPQRIISSAAVAPTTGATVGIAQGVILGDPDTSAVDRLSRRPVVHHVSELLRAGVVVHPRAWTAVNAQNTAFRRELAPAMLMCSQFGRYDDIFAGLVCQRVMREDGLRVHHGRPFVWQERNYHNGYTDLRAELWGMERVDDFTDFLDSVDLSPRMTVIERARAIYEEFSRLPWCPAGVREFAAAWLADCERAMG